MLNHFWLFNGKSLYDSFHIMNRYFQLRQKLFQKLDNSFCEIDNYELHLKIFKNNKAIITSISHLLIVSKDPRLVYKPNFH